MTLIGDVNARWTGSQTRDTKEDVTDMLYDTAQISAPALAMMARGAAPGNRKKEWVVVFTNEKVKDPKEKMLYIFLTLDGQYIAANYTGD